MSLTENRSGHHPWFSHFIKRDVRLKAATVCIVVLLFNGAIWLWALRLWSGDPVLMGLCALIYGLGLRHALDADHIAAIDNVTRKLMTEQRCAVGAGLFFALGHSLIVLGVTLLVVRAGGSSESGIAAIGTLPKLVGTLLSSAMLLALAVANAVVLARTWRLWRRVRAGDRCSHEEIAMATRNLGLLGRILHPLLGLVSRSWQMVFLGLVFGLSFDTATEVAMITLAANEADRGALLSAIMVFPLLFAAGMVLLDTVDSLIMVGAFRWSLGKPETRLRTNIVISSLSVKLALLIASVQLLPILVGQEGSSTVELLRAWVAANSSEIGLAVLLVCIVVWAGSSLVSPALTHKPVERNM